MIRLVFVALMALSIVETASAQSSWSGWYIGGTVTYGSGHDTGDTVVSRCCSSVRPFGFVTSGPDHYQLKPTGWLAGGQLGFNWQVSPKWLIGLEADYQDGTLSGRHFKATNDSNNGVYYSDTVEQRISKLGTARARLGFIDGNVLYFVTGGIATANVRTNVSDSISFFGSPVFTAYDSIGDRRLGWVIGGGGEFRTSDRWSFKVEYLFMNLGSQQLGFINYQPCLCTHLVSMQTDITNHLFRVGLNYRLSGL